MTTAVQPITIDDLIARSKAGKSQRGKEKRESNKTSKKVSEKDDRLLRKRIRLFSLEQDKQRKSLTQDLLDMKESLNAVQVNQNERQSKEDIRKHRLRNRQGSTACGVQERRPTAPRCEIHVDEVTKRLLLRNVTRPEESAAMTSTEHKGDISKNTSRRNVRKLVSENNVFPGTPQSSSRSTDEERERQDSLNAPLGHKVPRYKDTWPPNVVDQRRSRITASSVHRNDQAEPARDARKFYRTTKVNQLNLDRGAFLFGDRTRPNGDGTSLSADVPRTTAATRSRKARFPPLDQL